MMHGDDPLYRNGGEDRRDFDIPTGLLRVAAIFAVSFWLVSQLPIALVPVGLSQLLLVAAFATSVLARILGESVSAPALTRWDEAAILLALALIAGMFVDPEAAKTALDSLNGAAPVAGNGGSR